LILGFSEVCNNIYFVINGSIDLEILDPHGDVITLETLQQGAIIGQYSVLYKQDQVYRMMAKSTTVRLLMLPESFFTEYGDKDKIEGFQKAIRLAEENFNEFGIPTCDFKKYDC